MQHHLLKIRSLLGMTFFRLALFLILGVVLFITMYQNVKPEKLDLNLFSVAEQTIRSPITIEDKVSTAEKKKEAENQVKDVYILNKDITQNRIDLITSIYNSVKEVNTDFAKKADKEENAGEGTGSIEEEKLKNLKSKLSETVAKDLSDASLKTLLSTANDDLTIARDLSVTAINKVMSSRIPARSVENAKKEVEEELRYTSLGTGLKNATIELGRYAIIQNEFYDPQATKELRNQAVEAVDPVKILQGQIIVEENQLIDRDIYRQLELVGLLDNKHSLKPFAGLLIFITLFITALYYYFNHLDLKNEIKHSYMMQFSLIFLLSIVLMKLISFFPLHTDSEIAFVFPAAVGAMLLKILIDEKIAILYTSIMAICGSIMFNEGVSGSLHLTIAIYILCSGFAAIMFLSKHNHRAKILRAGLFVSIVNVLVIFSILFLRNSQYSVEEYAVFILLALTSGVLSAVLTIGLLPFFEAGFGILSTMKLIELSNPNHPLLRKILTEAPGTYHHSIMVANLAESACEAIGANGLLARVGCYYHDIGKTKRPQFFIENQMNIENPHDHLKPETSKDVIMDHVKDGVDLLKKHRFPKEIIDIAEQHHGTTLLQFFYHKVLQSGAEVLEEEFRYPGPKAQTKEAAIVGISDSVEAAVRSMGQPTPEQIEGLVRNLIASRLQDNQFNECDITMKELDMVADTLCETLNGIFHSRIKYPELKEQRVKHA